MDAGRKPALEEFWTDSRSVLLIDERRDSGEKKLFQEFFNQSQDFHAHVWLASSGSSQSSTLSTKLIGLSKSALLASADSVNAFLNATSKDRWGLCLPMYHVGGLSIWARAHVGGHEVLDYSELKWNADRFNEKFIHDRITLLSLVPTQVYDLVIQNIEAPGSLRAVIVGGGALNPDLYARARALGWPILPSFGMTEAGSQIATSELRSLEHREFPTYKVLNHFEYRQNSQGLLGIRGPSLLTGYWQSENGESRFHRHDPADFFWTSDLVQDVGSGHLRPLGREADFVKILGEGVHLGQLEERFHKILLVEDINAFAIGAQAETRRGADLYLYCEPEVQEAAKNAVALWNLSCLPVERISGVSVVPKIPRTALGKIQRQLLSKAQH